jgi:hypothetical protein
MNAVTVVGGPRMKWLCRWLAIASALALCGCADLLPYPSFGNALGIPSYTRNVYVKDVVTQVECELYQFLKEYEKQENQKNYPVILDPDERATIKLSLQGELGGGLTYLGLDLSNTALATLAQFIAVNKDKIPTLAAGGRAKGVVTTEVDMSIPQRAYPAKHSRRTLGSACSNWESFDYLKYLFLKDWLSNFYDQRQQEAGAPAMKVACMSKVTLKTYFQIGAEVGTGLNAIVTPIVLLPFNGTSTSIGPSYSHTLAITFYLKEKGKFCRREKGAGS